MEHPKEKWNKPSPYYSCFRGVSDDIKNADLEKARVDVGAKWDDLISKITPEVDSAFDKENRPKKIVTLPDDLILDHILPRLPVKSLLRFKSVCRDWCFTICTPEFEKSRLTFSGSHHQFVVLPLGNDGWLSTSSLINNPNYLIIRESYKYKYKLPEIIGCCNGLVGCTTIKSHGVSIIIVLNPATRQQVEILGPDNSTGFNNYWFGYVSSVDDYYIVALDTWGAWYEYWTFSCKARIWKRTLCNLNRNARGFTQFDKIGKPALINDSLYWPLDIRDRCVGTEIVEINLVTEKYEIKPQINLANVFARRTSLVNLEGCLALHTTSPNKGCLDVWMLRQAGDWNSWELVVRFQFVDDDSPI